MKGKHTPGPWKVGFRDTISGLSPMIIGGEGHVDGGEHLANVFMMGWPGDGETEPNAYLISAAPQMLEVLEEVEWERGSSKNCPSCHQSKAAGHHPKCKLQAAIKKARGNS